LVLVGVIHRYDVDRVARLETDDIRAKTHSGDDILAVVRWFGLADVLPIYFEYHLVSASMKMATSPENFAVFDNLVLANGATGQFDAA
jgi:hypothetical protein